MRIGLASDHVGLEQKESLKAKVTWQGHTAEDLSAEQAGEYHVIKDQLASDIRRGRVERGMLICSGAIGASAVSQSHFSKLFKLGTGLAQHQFVLEESIHRAKQLRPSLSVVECS